MNQQMHQRNAALEQQMAQRRARKPTDLNMPDGLEDIPVVGDLVRQYNQLRDAEKRLDAIMQRKRLELQDTFSRNNKRQKIMRFWISNTCSGQPWQQSGDGDGDGDEQGFTFDSVESPTYHVRVQGRLLEYKEDDLTYSSSEDEDDEAEMALPPQARKRKPKTLVKATYDMTHYIKGFNVEFEDAPADFNDPNKTVVWKKPANHTDADDTHVIQFRRKADENTNVTICLTRDEQPERFRLSRALADTLDMDEADRAEVVMGLWEYVKAVGLSEDDDRRSIRCDDNLRQIFGSDSFYFPQVPERIIPHLHPLPQVRLPYTIRVDEEFHKDPQDTIYDVEFHVEDPLRALITKTLNSEKNQQRMREIADIDDKLAVLVQKVHHHKARHAFFGAFAKDPLNFINKWIDSQKKDLSVILAEAERGDVAGLEFADGGEGSVWASEVVKEAVRYRLAKAEANGR
jgi:SWI/SNF-related matrix-associated actin-dependent regulator of chromatin subfamily D